MEIRGVIVEKDGLHYRSMLTRKGWKCGKCGKGNVIPREGDKCRMCGAVVTEVHRP